MLPSAPVRDRWATARTVAAELGISLRRAYQIMSQVGYKTTRGRRRCLRPARISRLSDVLGWAADHQNELEMWAAASGRAKEARGRRLEKEIKTLRLLASAMARMPDPAPEVCFWLSLLCQHPGFFQLKEKALRTLTAAAVPSILAYVESEDRTIAPCRACADLALALGVSPLDYVVERGPCGDCEVGERYYLLCFRFAGIGEFSFFVRYEAGRYWLPDPGGLPRVTLSEGVLGEFEKPSRADGMAFAPEEICGGLAAALARLAAGCVS